MLLPRFTLRWMLLATTVAAVFCLTLSFAVRQQAWAVAVVTAGAALASTFALFVVTFFLTWSLAALTAMIWQRKPSGNPFANQLPPQQIVPPPDPD